MFQALSKGQPRRGEARRFGLAAAAVQRDEEIVGVGKEFFVDINAGEFHQRVGEF